MMEDFQQQYETKWKDIVENEDGTIDKEQLAKELYDYDVIFNKMKSLLDDWTGGKTANPWVIKSQLKEAHDSIFIRKSNASDDLCDFVRNQPLNEKLIREYFDEL